MIGPFAPSAITTFSHGIVLSKSILYTDTGSWERIGCFLGHPRPV
ncbi:hypothetical protein [Robinsoniella peoriensis]